MIPTPNSNNPYAPVREEEWTEDINGYHIVHTKSFDAKGRVVGLSTIHFRGEKQVGHAVQFVEADGYWHGGAYDEETGGGCQICQPFIEGEII